MNSALSIILMLPAILIAFTFHEYAHAVVADRLGDSTPRYQGRLTLNPIAHIDLFGILAVIFFHFGWAKPVQTNPSAYKDYYKGDLKVSLAGPIANLLVALITSIIFAFYIAFVYKFVQNSYTEVLFLMIRQIIIININISIFNLLPIPGLDGFSLFRDLFPKKFQAFQDKFYQYQFLFLMGIIFFGGRIIEVPCTAIANWMFGITTGIISML